MVAHVEMIKCCFECFHQFRMTMAKIIGATIQVQIDQPVARHVIKEVTLTFVDDQINAGFLPEHRLLGVPETDRFVDDISFGLMLEIAILKHE